MIQLNNQFFSTTKAIRDYINNEIRNQYPWYSVISQEHKDLIKALIGFYYQRNFVDSITSITVIPPKKYKKQQNLLVAHAKNVKPQILKISESLDRIGKLFEHKTEKSQKELDREALWKNKQTALRNTVYSQINQFKADYQSKYPNYDFSDHEVHHVDPKFDTIIHNWMKLKGINCEDIKLYYDQNGYLILADRELAKDFFEYHKKVAVLDYIPREENQRMK
jgi:hypothetical protein